MKKNGWLFLAVVPLLALLGCDAPGEVIDFGLNMRYESDAGAKGGSCTLSENESGGFSSRLDSTSALPDLFLKADIDPENDTYTVRIVEVLAYHPNSTRPHLEKVLVERTYDQTFGDKSGKEQIHVDSEDVGYDIDIQGLPRDVKQCPLVNSSQDDT
jgi:hypothetical protein